MEPFTPPSKKDKVKAKWKKLRNKEQKNEESEENGNETESVTLDPESTIIAFDLHHVLARPNKKMMAKLIWNHPEKKALMKALQASGFAKQIIWARATGKDDSVPEKKMKELTHHCPSNKDFERYSILNPLVSELCNCQDPDIDTFKLIGNITLTKFIFPF